MKNFYRLFSLMLVLIILTSHVFAQKTETLERPEPPSIVLIEVSPEMLPSKTSGTFPFQSQTGNPNMDSPSAASYVLNETEPNNAPATATPIPGTPAKVKGNIFPNADADWFSFTATAGDKVFAAVMTAFSSNGTTDSHLRLYAPDGTTVIEYDDNDGSFGSLSSSIAGATIPASGTYYLLVNHSLTQIRGYDLYLTVQSGSPTPEVEGNNDAASANAMPASGWVSGTHDPAADTDWFSVTLATGESVFISLDLDPERDNVQWNGRLGFALFGDANNLIMVVNDASTGSVANPLSEAFFFTAKNAGTYYVYVDEAAAATGGPTATYTVSISKFDALSGYTNYPSAAAPQTIGPGTGSVTSTITVPGSPRIKDLSVRITLNHALMADIDATLTSPLGNTIHLFSDIGAAATGGETQMDLFFNDNNAIPPSFTVLKPVGLQPEREGKLDQFKNMNAGGIWTLTLYDDVANASGGTLTAWSLDIQEDLTPDISGATVVFSTDFESGAAGFTHSGTADEWELGTPATPATTTIAGFATAYSCTQCWKTDLDNTYDINCNQTLLSPNIALPSGSGPLWISWAMKYQMESASFDHLDVIVQQVGNPASAVNLFEWLGATQTAGVGYPVVNVPQSAGWATHYADVSSFAGQNIELLVRLTSDATINLGGVAIDDVIIYQLQSCTTSTITLGTSPSVCNGATSASLPYTAVTGTPDHYSIDYDADAETAGFVDVVNAALPSSPISLTVPAVAAAAVAYNADITVIKTVDGCVSPAVAFTVTVNSLPPAAAGLENQARTGDGMVTFTVSNGGGYAVEWSADGSSPNGWEGGTNTPTVTVGLPIVVYARLKNPATFCAGPWSLDYYGTAYDPASPIVFGSTRYGQSNGSGSDFVDKNGKLGDIPSLSNYGQDLTSVSSPGTLTVTLVSASPTSSSDGTAFSRITVSPTPVIARGVCWSTSASPLIAGNHTVNGSGVVDYSSTITGLSGGTTYYVRAWAINSTGLHYSNEINFTTP